MTLRTRVYVDGYNLYYGCLRKTAHKWLDIRALAAQILTTIRLDVDGMPTTFDLDILAVKYFTAPILTNFARHEDSVPSQVAYHDALLGHLGSSASLIRGSYAAEPARAHRHIKGRRPQDCELVDIWRLVEKQSDVALALHAYSDALRAEVDHVSRRQGGRGSLSSSTEGTSRRVALKDFAAALTSPHFPLPGLPNKRMLTPVRKDSSDLFKLIARHMWRS